MAIVVPHKGIMGIIVPYQGIICIIVPHLGTIVIIVPHLGIMAIVAPHLGIMAIVVPHLGIMAIVVPTIRRYHFQETVGKYCKTFWDHEPTSTTNLDYHKYVILIGLSNSRDFLNQSSSLISA